MCSSRKIIATLFTIIVGILFINSSNRTDRINKLKEVNKYTQLVIDNGDSYIVTEDDQPIKCNGFGRISCEKAYHQSLCYKSANCLNSNMNCETDTIKPNKIRYFTHTTNRKAFMNLYIESTDTSSLDIDIALGSNIKKVVDGEFAITKNIGTTKKLLCKHFSSKKYISDGEKVGLVIRCNNLIQPCAYYVKYDLI